jgi:predicted  nucleic acid-binding Zn-ribbon protein
MDDQRLMDALAKLSSQIADVKDSLTEFREDVAAQFASLKDDMTVSMARADVAIDRTGSTRNELHNLQTQVSGIHRNQRRLTERVEKLERPGKPGG